MNWPQKNGLEWTVFAVSLALTLSALGYLGYGSWRMGDTPPRLRVETGPPQEQESGFIVPVAATNYGERTAEGVHIEVDLAVAGKEPETAGFDIAFVPRRSTRRGWVTFADDPRAGRLTARAIGYEQP